MPFFVSPSIAFTLQASVLVGRALGGYHPALPVPKRKVRPSQGRASQRSRESWWWSQTWELELLSPVHHSANMDCARNWDP